MRKRVTMSAFMKRLQKLGGDLEKAVERGAHSAMLRLQTMVVQEIDSAAPHPAVDRAMLRNSVTVTRKPKSWWLGVTAPHAPMIEYGTRPFWPPLQPLIDWASRKGIGLEEGIDPVTMGRMIAHGIATHGIKPRRFMAKAWARWKREKIFAREVGAELRLLQGRQ
jgi:hypothetical protein